MKVAQACLTLCDPMDCGLLQARILEWVAFPFSRGSSNPGIESRSSPLQADSLPAEPPGKPNVHRNFFFFSKEKNMVNLTFTKIELQVPYATATSCFRVVCFITNGLCSHWYVFFNSNSLHPRVTLRALILILDINSDCCHVRGGSWSTSIWSFINYTNLQGHLLFFFIIQWLQKQACWKWDQEAVFGHEN